MVKAEGARQITDAIFQSLSRSRLRYLPPLLEPYTRASAVFGTVLNISMVQHLSVIDPMPKINGHWRAVTVFFECKVAREAELMLEVCASLRRPDSVDNEAQRVEC